jgi:hypothetical protein
MTSHHALVAYFSCLAGNFIYQAINDQLWGVAAERSFFQAVAIATLVAVAWVTE